MSRFYRQIAVPFLVLFIVVMLLIRAQPYDDHELRALLMPEGCEMPCFMGIRPGVTTADEAVKLLEGNSWVKEIKSQKYPSSTYFYWRWNGHLPRIINGDETGSFSAKDGLVTSLTIHTTLPLGSIFLTYGTSNWMTTAGFDNGTNGFYFGYVEKQQVIGVENIYCNTWSNLIETKVKISFAEEIEEYPFEYAYNVGLENLRKFTIPFEC